MNHPTKSKSRLLAAVVHDVLRQEQFDTLADLIDAMKFRCARLKLGWTNDAIGDAIRMVASNKDVTRRKRRISRVERAAPPPMSHREASAILKRLGAL